MFLYLHFPCLQLDLAFGQCEQPLIIVDETELQVVQCNQAASAVGVSLGMNLAAAASLCPQLRVEPYQESYEQQALTDLAEHLYRYCADLYLDTPQGLLIALKPMLALYASPAELWLRLKRLLKLRRVQCLPGFSDNPLVARILAKAAAPLELACPIKANAQFKGLPLSQLELSKAQYQTLSRLGLNQIGDLLALPQAELRRRISKELAVYLAQLRGEQALRLPAFEAKQVFRLQHELLFEVYNSQHLQKPLGQLLEELEEFLTEHDQLAMRLSFQLYLRSATEPYEFELKAANGEYLASAWSSLLALRLERVKLSQPVVSVALFVDSFKPQQLLTQDLFQAQSQQLSPYQLVSLLQTKLGEAQVNGVAWCDHHWPELANQIATPLLAAKLPEHSLLRPSFQLLQPKPLLQQVRLLMGPERLVFPWSELGHLYRDYYLGLSAEGQYWWVFRDQQNSWSLHGMFS